MDFNEMLSQLRSERDQIDAAIIALEHLARGGGKRRGRPPKWMSEASAESPAAPAADGRRRPRKFSAEARKRMAEAQRRRWAAKNEAAQES